MRRSRFPKKRVNRGRRSRLNNSLPRPRTSKLSPVSISRHDVEKVSLLARLQLTDQELAAMTEQLSQIVDYVNLLSEVDTEGVEPMAHAIEIHNVFAADAVRPSLPRDEALSAAPHHNQQGYLVPAVLGQ